MIRKSSILRVLILCSVITGLGACSTMDVMQNKAVRIDGDIYHYNDDWEIELTEQELKRHESSGSIVRIKHVAPTGALILDLEEMRVLMQDRAVFFSELDKKNPPGEVSVLIKKGSLRENMERIIKKERWDGVVWNLTIDFYVSKPFAVVGPDVQAVIMEVINGYPIYVNFNEDNLIISEIEKDSNVIKLEEEKTVSLPGKDGTPNEIPNV